MLHVFYSYLEKKKYYMQQYIIQDVIREYNAK